MSNGEQGTNRIVRLCKEAGIEEPVFKEAGGSFVVSFSRAFTEIILPEIKLTITQRRILEYLSKVEAASTSEISDKIATNPSTIQRAVKKLEDFIEWTGKSINYPLGKYKLKKNSS